MGVEFARDSRTWRRSKGSNPRTQSPPPKEHSTLMKLHRIAAVAGAAALLLPAGVFAKGKPEDPGSKGKGHSKAKTFVFKGTWNDAASTVAVTGGNSRVRKGGFKG